MTNEITPLGRELRQTRPFPSRAQEAAVGILRTSSVLHRHVARVLEPFGITSQQYNVLRILRGSHPEPLSRQEIGDRMVEEQPGVTRLLDRLESKGLVRRERSTDDRRVVYCWITPEGLALVGALDQPILQAHEQLLGRLGEAERVELIRLLDLVRAFDR